MRIKILGIIIILIITSITFLTILVNNHAKAETIIEPDSSHSPIKKYFTTKKILWTLDDYFIHKDHHPPHKGFYGLTKKITGYGGHVNIMVIFTTETFTKPYDNKIIKYSVVRDFKWDQEKIDKSLDFFSQQNVYAQCHGWNHSAELNTISEKDAYTLVYYTMMNWLDNYNIKPNFFLAHASTGNYNLTLALKKFSENYWPVYGEQFRWFNSDLFPITKRDSPAVEYVGKGIYVAMFDPLFGCDWDVPCETLDDAKNLFNKSSENMEILFIRGHPNFLNETDDQTQKSLILWEDWIDWIYQNHNLININHTQAIYYNTDRENFRVVFNNPDKITIDMLNCSYDHNILFTQPYDNKSYNWTLENKNGNLVGFVTDDVYIKLEKGNKYILSTTDNVDISDSPVSIQSESSNEPEETSGFISVLFFISLIIVYFLKKKK